MIIDNDKMVLFIQEKIMQISGFSNKPYKYEDASKALGYFKPTTKNHQKVKDVVVFLDINMPYVSGWEFLDELKKLKLEQKIHVIVVTSSIDLRDKENAFEYNNVVDYFIKPVTTEDLEKLKLNKRIKHLF